jgi:hypothetical protein
MPADEDFDRGNSVIFRVPSSITLTRAQASRERELHLRCPWNTSEQNNFFSRIEMITRKLDTLRQDAESKDRGTLRTLLGVLGGPEGEMLIEKLRNEIRGVKLRTPSLATLGVYWEMTEPLLFFQRSMMENNWDDLIQGSTRYYSRLCVILMIVDDCVNDLKALPPRTIATGFALGFTPEMGDPLDPEDSNTMIEVKYRTLPTARPSWVLPQSNVSEGDATEEMLSSGSSTRFYINSQAEDIHDELNKAMMDLQWCTRIRGSIQKRADDNWRSVFLYLNSGHCSGNFDADSTLEAQHQANITAIADLGNNAAAQAAANPFLSVVQQWERAKVSNARHCSSIRTSIHGLILTNAFLLYTIASHLEPRTNDDSKRSICASVEGSWRA